MTSVSALKRRLQQRGKAVAASKENDGGPQEALRLELMAARAEVKAAEALFRVGPGALSTNRQQVSQSGLQELLDVAAANLAEVQQRCIEHGVEVEDAD